MEFSNRDEISRILAYFNAFVILFVPTLSFVTTHSYRGDILRETTYYWPWMILIRIQPAPEYYSDQWVVSGIPWILLVFIPFFYTLRASYNMINDEKGRVNHILTAAIGSIGQLLFIYIMSQSQVGVQEEVTLWFIPELLLLFVNGYIWFSWFYTDYKLHLEEVRRKKQERGSSQE